MKRIREDKWLERVAKQLQIELRSGGKIRGLRLRKPRIQPTDTGGWTIVLGMMGDFWLDLWFDKFTGHEGRVFYAGVYAQERKEMDKLVKAAAKKWPPNNTFQDEDLEDSSIHRLKKPLRASDWDRAILELYDSEPPNCFFGFYHRMDGSPGRIQDRFVATAKGFFLDLLDILSQRTGGTPEEDHYPRTENRALVRRHLHRERDRFLPAVRKELDGYRCGICGFQFETLYGPLGAGFAEAHHKLPLASSNRARTSGIEDFLTVCANCHRMLHRMTGNPADIGKLRRIVGKNRSKTRR
jgi:hypothetical protein